MNKSSTFSDVAKEAGVSTATVSRAFNRDPSVLPETREKVFSAAKKIGYVFNDTARSLKTQKSRTIGFICPELSNNFFMEIAEGIEIELNHHGYHLLLRHTQSNPEKEETAINDMLSRRVDGLILIPSDENKLPSILKTSLSTPCLTVDRSWHNQNFPEIITNNKHVTTKAIEYFYRTMLSKNEQGEEWIYIGGHEQISTAGERLRGFKEAMDKLSISNWRKEINNFDAEGGYTAAKKIFASLPYNQEKGINIFVANYFMNLGVTEFLLENRIPKSMIRMCAFDYSPQHKLFQYSKLFIHQPHLEMGTKAVETLFAMLNEEKVSRKTILNSSFEEN
ncbi:MAG: LacI family DNA-binding transcriptional regulator [Spirochaetales bacterium]|nr:LacI family DNA-binding transcriptional regulator [Spirochaetales bacterium]